MEHSITYYNVPRETFNAAISIYTKYDQLFDSYIDQLMWWNKRINLISRDVSRETIVDHIQHSLLLTQFPIYSKSKSIVDAGTGGGLPGIPLAITATDKRFILNDIVKKKMLAVKQIVRQQGLSNIETFDQTIGKLALSNPFLLISKHAFKINNLLELTAGQPWTHLVLYKGLPFEDEIDDIQQPLDIDVYDLSHNSKAFYEDKAIIILSR